MHPGQWPHTIPGRMCLKARTVHTTISLLLHLQSISHSRTQTVHPPISYVQQVLAMPMHQIHHPVAYIHASLSNSIASLALRQYVICQAAEGRSQVAAF
jgi:hypothetical protein